MLERAKVHDAPPRIGEVDSPFSESRRMRKIHSTLEQFVIINRQPFNCYRRVYTKGLKGKLVTVHVLNLKTPEITESKDSAGHNLSLSVHLFFSPKKKFTGPMFPTFHYVVVERPNETMTLFSTGKQNPVPEESVYCQIPSSYDPRGFSFPK